MRTPRLARPWRPIPGRRFRALWAAFLESARRALRALVQAAERTTEAWRLDSLEGALGCGVFEVFPRAAAAVLAKIDQRRAALAGACA